MSKIKNNNLPDELLQEMLFPKDMWEKSIKHYTQTISFTFHHFYITDEIEDDMDKYIDMINVMKTCDPNDQVFVYLNTPGGCLSTTIQIIAAIDQCPATVTTVIEGEVCSAGTLIFLAGDDYMVNDHCSMMIHNYSHGAVGKGKEVKSQVDFSERYFEKLSNYFYEDFLTPEEIADVCNDKDIWMDSQEITERLIVAGLVEVPEEEEGEEEEEDDPMPMPRKRRATKAEVTKAKELANEAPKEEVTPKKKRAPRKKS